MSTYGIRSFRPKLHFTAPSMWLNDPNGLVYKDGVYHLFYQYHPGSPEWGPMHWGHAVSKDLICWKHLPIALYPDSLGTIFSGSAVCDTDNTSGLGAMGCAPLVAVYTQDLQGPTRRVGRKQHQSLAYSLDGVNFIKYHENPVIPCPDKPRECENQLPSSDSLQQADLRSFDTAANKSSKEPLFQPGQIDFRDPKVFRNRISNCWGLVLCSGDYAEFFNSSDLIHWIKSGEFGPFENGILSQGVWECPDLLEFDTEEGIKHVLILSLALPAELGGSRTVYVLGSYDGSTFTADETESPIWLDEGFDNYAGVTFDNTGDKLLIGWAGNWKYSALTPTTDYCGAMILARKLDLRKTPAGWRLSAVPAGLASYIRNVRNLRNQDVITSETFGIALDGEGDCQVSLVNATGQTLSIGIKDGKLCFDRSKAGSINFSKEFAQTYFSRRSVSRWFTGPWHMDIIFDVSQVEIFLDNGTVSMCSSVYPDTPYNCVILEGCQNARYMDFQVPDGAAE